jgi:polyisoprenoid-binding protein YceI
MRLQLTADSRVLVDLRATGLLKAVGHDPTVTARPEPASMEVEDATPIDVPVRVRFRADRIEPPTDISTADAGKMRDNLRSAEVLDVGRFPFVDLEGRYTGTLEGGRLQGHLTVRGVPRPLSMDIVVVREGEGRTAKGTWSGRLTDLGIKPFKALMGALRLEDWVRIRLEARLV